MMRLRSKENNSDPESLQEMAPNCQEKKHISIVMYQLSPLDTYEKTSTWPVARVALKKKKKNF